MKEYSITSSAVHCPFVERLAGPLVLLQDNIIQNPTYLTSLNSQSKKTLKNYPWRSLGLGTPSLTSPSTGAEIKLSLLSIVAWYTNKKDTTYPNSHSTTTHYNLPTSPFQFPSKSQATTRHEKKKKPGSE